MIEATPSIMKNAINTSVSEKAPVSGEPSSIAPTMTPSAADNSDHQKPGACRIQKLVTKPTMPLTRKSQPSRIVTARVAIGGSDDGCRAKHQQHDTFDEEEHPVLMKRGHSRALNTLNAGLLGGHESLHGFLP